MPDRHIDRMERQPEQLLRAVERRLDHAVELEVRLHLGLLEVAAPRAELLGVVAPVPGGDLEVAALLRDQLLQGVAVGERGLARRLPDLFQQPAHRLRRLRHGVVEPIMRERRIAEQLGALDPQRHGLGDDRLVVGLVAFVAARDPGAERLLAQIAPRRELQERLDAGALQGDDVLALHAALVGRGGRRFAHEIGQAGEIGLAVELHRVGLLVGQHVLAERGAERRQPLDDGGKALLLVGIERRALAAILGVMALQHARLLGGEAEAVALADKARRCARTGRRSSAPCSSAPRCGARCRARSPAACRCCRCRQSWPKMSSTRCKARPAFSSATMVLSKRRRLLLARDRGDLGLVLGEGALIGRHEMLGLDAGKRRRAERRVPGLEEGIVWGSLQKISTSFRTERKRVPEIHTRQY